MNIQVLRRLICKYFQIYNRCTQFPVYNIYKINYTKKWAQCAFKEINTSSTIRKKHPNTTISQYTSLKYFLNKDCPIHDKPPHVF